MVAGLAVGHLVSGFISPTSSPFLAVGGTAIDLTPLWLKDFAVRSFGSYDKVVLLSGMAAVIGLVGVAAGLLSRRSRTLGLVLLVVLGVVATVAVLTRPTAGALDVLAPLVALIVSVGTFVVLHRLGRRTEVPTRDEQSAAGVSRRGLLVGSVTV
ncbi:MAG: molybdopterin-binding protein, partial [Pseudonocardiaceae bacterium]